MSAPEIIRQLVAKFTENRDAYRSGKYNEARLRQEFLDPFFEALGWDVYNRAGVAPDYADVVIEDSLEIEGAGKNPDYAFKIGRERKFYVEAKKPKVDIQYDIHPAYQLRRYAWNAHLPLSILTDFEELAVYNCKNKPNPSDSAATARDKFYRYTDYVEKWDEIAAVFSRDAVWKGSFDRFAASSKGKKGTTGVDDAILTDIEEWRKLLAQNIALRNQGRFKGERQLNYAVQMTIDRVLFLRICEDRGIEPDEQLKDLGAEPNIYPRLVELFRRADKKYNSGLFHFEKEKENGNPVDTFTPSLTIDDKVLKDIINRVYYPCPYIFKEIPVEILGQVYEQFLGSVIHLTPSGQARIDVKPEVRKAGGVYYTPQYIVDYIVANTVGKLLEGKTPGEAAALKIVDPACGSGSFLLGAYQYLLDWHEDWYTKNDPEKWTTGKDPALMPAAGGGYRLTTQKRKQILVNNIHGVDIDPQAVEVTKLSLLLKVLEEESGQLTLGFERALPDLGRNIQCGNSLIGPDYFDGQLVIDEAERRRVNPFDWPSAFPEVYSRGGFDAVIGNPPYGASFDDEDKRYFTKHFHVSQGRFESYWYFIEEGIKRVKVEGYLSLIVPDTWFSLRDAELLRKYVLSENQIERIVGLNENVFGKVKVDVCIFVLQKSAPKDLVKVFISSKDKRFLDLSENAFCFDHTVDQRLWLLNQESRITLNMSTESQVVLNKLENESIRLGEISIATTGPKPYQVGKGIPPQTKKIIEQKPFSASYQKDETFRIMLHGSDISRYSFPIKNDDWLSYGKWLAEIRDPEIFSKERLLIQSIRNPKLARRIIATYINDNSINNNSITNLVIREGKNYSIFYILGILNSSLINWLFAKSYNIVNIDPRYLKAVPIRTIDFSNPADVKRHDQIVALVTRMLDLHKRVPATPLETEQLARDIAATDRAIDDLVYDLYALTPAEIKIVES